MCVCPSELAWACLATVQVCRLYHGTACDLPHAHAATVATDLYLSGVVVVRWRSSYVTFNKPIKNWERNWVRDKWERVNGSPVQYSTGYGYGYGYGSTGGLRVYGYRYYGIHCKSVCVSVSCQLSATVVHFLLCS